MWSFTNCKEALGNILCRKETMLMEKAKREGCLLWMVFEGEAGEDGDFAEPCFRLDFRLLLFRYLNVSLLFSLRRNFFLLFGTTFLFACRSKIT